MYQYAQKNSGYNTDCSHKHFSEYMKISILNHSNNNEISSIISSLNPNKAVGPNGIPTKILTLLKDGISYHVSDIYDISFFMAVFPSVLKTALKSFLNIKMALSLIAITIIQYLFYQILKKNQKNCYITELLNF